jgi:hypothetical protein
MGWIASRIDKWASKKQADELAHFVEMLRGMDGAELGHVVALAANLRHGIEAGGHQPLDPIAYTARNPGFPLLLSRLVAEAQKQGRLQDAAGLMVWTHTARAGARLELRASAREMWRQLARGYPHVNDAAHAFQQSTGHELHTGNWAVFPTGFTPDPL